MLELQFDNINEAIKVYVGMRDDLKVFQERVKKEEAEKKEFLDRISMWLRDKADELGVDNFKTESGTAYRNIKKSYRVEDWDAICAYIQETGNFQILEKRVAKRATEEIVESDGDVPPGISVNIEVEFNVLRPKGTSKK